MKNYFAFIDESGNSTQERFFGLGLEKLRTSFNVKSLAISKTYHKPNYFSVWEFRER